MIFMKNEIQRIVSAMCVPGILSMEETDLSFIGECENCSYNELYGNTVSDAVSPLAEQNLCGVKNMAVTIFTNKNDRHVSVNEIAGLQDVLSNLDTDTNVVWGFGFSDIPLGKRKVVVLLAS